jgi:hypothetical protein
MRMVKIEAEQIYSSPVARRGRSYEEVENAVKQGKIAELYLIENHGFEEANKKWHDLINEENEYIEVKAYNVWDKNAPGVQRDLKRLREEGWNISKWYYLFKCKYGEYELLEKIKIR